MTQGEEKARERTADVGDEGAEETEHHHGARHRQQGEAPLTPAHEPIRYASQGAPSTMFCDPRPTRGEEHDSGSPPHARHDTQSLERARQATLLPASILAGRMGRGAAAMAPEARSIGAAVPGSGLSGAQYRGRPTSTSSRSRSRSRQERAQIRAILSRDGQDLIEARVLLTSSMAWPYPTPFGPRPTRHPARG